MLTAQVHLSMGKIEKPFREEIRIFTNAEQDPIRIPVYVIDTKNNNTDKTEHSQ